MQARQQNNLDLPDSNEAKVHWCLVLANTWEGLYGLAGCEKGGGR